MDAWVVTIGFAIIVAAVAGVVFSAREDAADRREWQAFVDARHCRIVERRDEGTSTGYGHSIGVDGKVRFGVTTITTEPQECWLCDDGVRYWKRAGLAEERVR